jgi:hypothetical protein
MKALTVLGLVTCLTALAIPQDSTFRSLQVDGKEVSFDAMPREVNGHLMVPLRPITDAMNATLRWKMADRIATVWKNGQSFDIMIGSRETQLNEQRVTLDEAPFISKGRIFVPLKFLAMATKYSISTEGGIYTLRNTLK